jgi:small subunit ribosomal protein S11
VAKAVKKTKKKIQVDTTGRAYIKATFNNVLVTLTDVYGNTISWSSAGKTGSRGRVRTLPSPPRYQPRARRKRPTTSACARLKCS